jgi:hypothetical protein
MAINKEYTNEALSIAMHAIWQQYILPWETALEVLYSTEICKLMFLKLLIDTKSHKDKNIQ